MTEKIILGIDEVGRGPWAGPLVVGAVILDPEFKKLPEYEQLTDSKKLTAKKREALNDLILKHAAATSLGWVTASEIDHYGLGPALKLAARRAVKPILAQITQNLQTLRDTSAGPQIPNDSPDNTAPNSKTANSLQKFDEIIIDGTINLLTDTPLADKVALLPKADFLIKEVSAASIIAKVARDRYMADLAEKYPGYSFEKHVGYGTAAHKSALLELGPCPEHRKSFRPIAEILATFPTKSHPSSAPTTPQDPTTTVLSKTATTSAKSHTPTTTIGQKAEQAVANYLETQQNHIIIARNFKTKSYEIDLISIAPNQNPLNQNSPTSNHPTSDQTLYFTEVKYRRSAARGAPLAAITPKKQQQIRFAAESFIATHPEYQNYQPVLAVASVSGSDFHLDDWFVLPE